MTDNGIIKALECCISEDRICEECLYEGESYGNLYCDDKLMVDVFNLIKRQQEEIEELRIITGLLQKRKYYNKFVKEVFQKEQGSNLAYPDADEIYKRYFDQQAEIEKLKNENQILNQKRANIFEIANTHEREYVKAIKDFQEKLKELYKTEGIITDDMTVPLAVIRANIDDIAEEMIGDR